MDMTFLLYLYIKVIHIVDNFSKCYNNKRKYILIFNLTIKFYIILFSLFFVALVALPSKVVFASAVDGTISGSAWSSQIGWINFGTTLGNARITNSTLSGYAWNENIGWINLNPSGGGVVNSSSGNLSGSAWSNGTGWINFSGVIVNSSGVFSGTATGDNNVNINFSCSNCNVTTDWRPALSVSGDGVQSSSISGGGVQSSSIIANYILINNSTPYTNNSSVVLSFNQNSDIKKMAISNSFDFGNIGQEDYQPTKNWVLNEGDGQKIVYVKLYNQDGNVSSVVSSSIILDTKQPDIKITYIKDSYNPEEEIIISGETEANAQIALSLKNSNGFFRANSNGGWFVTLGKLPLGSYNLSLTATDLAGNKGTTLNIVFLVDKNVVIIEPPPPSFLDRFGDLLRPLMPNFLAPPKESLPEAVITVPEITPISFRGSFRYISTATLANFVLAPFPNDIRLLAQKFTKIKETLSQVGIEKYTDILKLRNSKLSLPNLTEAVLPQSQLTVGKFSNPKSIPLEGLSEIARTRIPSAVVFAKIADGLIDVDIGLSLSEQGKIEQKIKTVAGHSIQLIVRADRPVDKVIGYLVFKSRKYSPISFNTIINNMTASLISANSEILSAINPNNLVQEDNKPENEIEERLILSQFEYQKINSDIYIANIIAPVVNGQFEIITQMDYLDKSIKSKEIKLIMLVDPEGYVYQKSGNLETRIAGAIVSIYSLNPKTEQYELWLARDYSQENPQTTDIRGTYSFLVPNGNYYLKVDAAGYLSYEGQPFEVREGNGVHINIEMKTKYWFYDFFDWKTFLLVLIVLMLSYNFYKDRKREIAEIV